MEVALLLGFFFVMVCTLDPSLLRPGMWVPGVGQPSPALIAFMFCFVLFVHRLCEVVMVT